MNAEQFREQAELDATVADFLDEVAQASTPDQMHRSVTLGVVFGVTAYALYRLAKNYFDHKRGLDEAELRQGMLDQVEELVGKGWDREKALAVVMKVSKEIATLRPDSPALEAAVAILGKNSETTQS